MSVNAKQNGSLKKLANFGMDALETIITKLFKNADEQSFPMASDSAEGINLLKNVEIDTPTDGQVLKYDATNEVWVNGQGGSSYTAGDGIDITNDTISLAYLKVVNGAVNIIFDDGN